MAMNGLAWKRLHSVEDERGSLTAVEELRDIPFEIRRVFYMHDVAPGSDRGGHAHRDTDQLAVAVHGAVTIRASNGVDSSKIVLDHPGWGIILPRMTWTRLVDFSPGAVCLVLANTYYDMSKSIRTWPEYLAERALAEYPEPTEARVFSRTLEDSA